MFIINLCLLFLSSSLWADIEIETRIHDIDYGQNSGDKVLLFLESGHVGKLNDKIINFSKRDWVVVTIDDRRNVIKVRPSFPTSKVLDDLPPSFLNEPYKPTVLDNGMSKKYFRESRITRRGKTQCYNRAHIWAFELWKKHNIKTQKIFLFFSRKYIREHNYGWWFHVAPMVVTSSWGSTSEKVIDPHFIRAPRDINWWKNKFVSGKRECPVIEKYSDYADYPYSHDCYLLKASMYIYQPLDLEMLEVWNIQKSEFFLNDVQWAYKEAFGINYSGVLI